MTSTGVEKMKLVSFRREPELNNKVKKVAVCAVSVMTATAVILAVLAKIVRKNDKFLNDPGEQNPLYKKRVVFAENEDEPVNADGKRGHLEVVGEGQYKQTFYEKHIKRAIDVILCFFGVIVCAPIYLVTAIAIKLDSPGPVIFKQKRIAKDNGWFSLWKFRTYAKASDIPTHMMGNKAESGITRVGAILRKYSIDETIQFAQVLLTSHLSLIGPRPALWNQDYLVAERDKYGANDVKPGITGLAQVSGRDELEIEEKARLDGEYVRRLRKSSWSGFTQDVEIFVKTILSVVKSDGVVEGGTGAMKKESVS